MQRGWRRRCCRDHGRDAHKPAPHGSCARGQEAHERLRSVVRVATASNARRHPTSDHRPDAAPAPDGAGHIARSGPRHDRTGSSQTAVSSRSGRASGFRHGSACRFYESVAREREAKCSRPVPHARACQTISTASTGLGPGAGRAVGPSPAAYRRSCAGTTITGASPNWSAMISMIEPPASTQAWLSHRPIARNPNDADAGSRSSAGGMPDRRTPTMPSSASRRTTNRLLRTQV